MTADHDLGALTGVRSGKRSFYPEYVRSAERLERAVGALDRISRALVRTGEGPRALVEAVVRAAAEHVQADWLLFAVADGALRAARPRFLLLTGDRLVDDERLFPAAAAEHLRVLRSHPWEADDPPASGVRVPMTLDCEPVGGIAAMPAPGMDVADTDLAVLRVLANQAAVALHNSFLVHATVRLRGRTERLSEAAEQQARDLAARNAELQETQRRLFEAMQRQALDDERHRIARELHDSVTQDVLSAGMMIEICRADLAGPGADLGVVSAKLVEAKGLTRHAVERLRAAIYALHHAESEPSGSLPVLLERLSTVHLPTELKVRVTVRGTPVPLPGEAEHSLLRIAGEALFNTVMHTNAARALIRLDYRGERIRLSISDDGDGDPAQLRRMLRLASATDLAGAHRGLANMRARTEELGGTLSIRRSRIGGIMLLLEIPPPRHEARAAG
ncbi:MadS family sensor histidine kinase [Amycolatopsis alkalitolerans]|uniref:Sensor histidine kinase n=1 Tax=Amycolatopsis alkalitolerans TaxID=2547244 RepID=A0A5C4LRR0_9PSEU|nr:histidine kinase [Amycolatopsis alkalitolerans]TNC21528.1 sensor histidine kinase [Amycolatopsis alkalitolerans]